MGRGAEGRGHGLSTPGSSYAFYLALASASDKRIGRCCRRVAVAAIYGWSCFDRCQHLGGSAPMTWQRSHPASSSLHRSLFSNGRPFVRVYFPE